MPERPILNKVSAAADLLQVCERSVYALIASGELESVKVRGSRRIPTEALDRYVESLRTEAGNAVAAQ